MITMQKKRNTKGKHKKHLMFSLKNFLTVGFMLLLSAFQQLQAAKFVEVKVIDKDYLQVFFKDGDVVFVDDGLGANAYTSTHQTANNSIVRYGTALNTSNAVATANWKITSADDSNYGTAGHAPDFAYRKSKLNGMAELDWGSSDWNYEYSMEHSIFLKLPSSLAQGKTYTLEINANTNTDVTSETFTYDIFNSHTEAIHVNLSGYIATSGIKAADLYIWMGNGGARNYSGFEGNNVYIYDINTQTSQQVGTVTFWKSSAGEAQGYNFTQSTVWNADFTGFDTPGTYRLAIEGVGCSENFVIGNNAYHDPFMVNTQGYYYMRIGEDRLDMEPVPRRPLYLPGVSPSNTTVYITTMEYTHPQWGSLTSGDVWDAPNAWAPYSTGRTNPNAYGGHSDALDWDRHLSHVSNIYDLLLPYILTYGALSDDDLDIGESGNGIPDVLDEARNEVDFWLRLRDGMGYSCGLTNPNSSNVLYQAGTNAIAAWANALNSSMLAECFRIAGQTDLMNTYLDSAIAAYNYAGSLPNQMLDFGLDEGNGKTRGRDIKMAAAAYLYNLTGDTNYEDVVNDESVVTGTTSAIINLNTYNQLYATAGYLKTNQTVNYPTLFDNMKASVIYDAKNREANYTNSRPSRRATDNNLGYFHTAQNVHRTIVAHSVATSQSDLNFLENALILEADWGLGRNPSNLIQMTTASTPLSSKRSIEAAYTSGEDDGSVGQHPGHTPYMNMDNWSSGMITGRPSWMGDKCYPTVSTWPKAETWFNTRYVWAHAEFTPQQTMRGKQALYGYLYALGKGFAVIPVTGVSVSPTTASITGNGTTQLTATVIPSDATYKTVTWSTSDTLVATVNSSGLVKGGVSSGTATITVTTVIGGFSATSQITVARVPVASVSVSPTSALINVNNTQQLNATITPTNASDKKVTWSSDNTTIAAVSSSGLVTGIAQGSATITATTNDGSQTATCNVSVNHISATGVSINAESTSMFAGETQQLSITFTPSNATNQNVTWDSNNESVATVNSSGLVTAIGAGSATITVTAQDGGLTDNVEISVEISSDIIIYRDASDLITGWWDQNGTLTRQSSGGSEGVKCLQFNYSLSNWWSGLGIWFPSVDVSLMTNLVIDFSGPTTSGAYTYIYIGDANGNTSETYDVVRSSSYATATIPLAELIGESDIDLSKINEIGVNVTGVSSGSGTLYFDNIYFGSPIPIIPVTSVTVSPSSGVIDGGTLHLTATVLPANATNKDITWSSSNPSVASVNSAGLVMGNSVGTATITVTTTDGGYSASASITVNSPTEGRVIKVMPLGNSITQGDGRAASYLVPGGYRLPLWQNLEEAGLDCGVEFVGSLNTNPATGLPYSDHEGHSGWTTGQILAQIDNYMSEATPDIVMMHLGTNDVAQNVVAQAPANLRGLIDHICAALPPDGKLYVAKIIPMGGVGNAASIAYNDLIVVAVTEKQGEGLPVYLVDAYGMWQNEYYDAWGASNCDWTHPGQLGYNALGDFWFNVIKDDVQLPCGITVVPVSGVTLDIADSMIYRDSTLQLTNTVLPGNATNKNVTWNTSDELIATVSSSGLVTGISSGIATITVTTEDGNKTASSTITVVSILENITVNNTTLYDGDIECYNAFQTITVAGDNQVLIENGATAEFIAGQSIRFLSGFSAQSGSYVNASITISNSFCSGSSSQSIVSAQTFSKSIENDETEKVVCEYRISDMKVYPNPNPGRFIIELIQFENMIPVIVYNSMGMVVYNEELNPAIINEINIPNLRNGIYFIKAYCKEGQLVQKIIVNER